MSIYGKFVSHSFKREGPKTVQCDVPVIGQFIMERGDDSKQKLRYDFVPSSTLQSECCLKKNASSINFTQGDPTHLRKDLQVGKIAEVGQIDVDQAQNILNLIAKSIVS